MKILFTKNVARQGQVGDVKEVADGFAQFLINAGNATKATTEVVKANENKIKFAKLKADGEEKYINELSKLLKDETIKISGKKNEKGHYYVAIHRFEIAAEISKILKTDFNEKYLEDVSIKETGIHDMKVVFKSKNIGSFKVELL
jgi:large subunit ribosomal protein L9